MPARDVLSMEPSSVQAAVMWTALPHVWCYKVLFRHATAAMGNDIPLQSKDGSAYVLKVCPPPNVAQRMPTSTDSATLLDW